MEVSEDKVMRAELQQGRLLGEGSSSEVYQVNHVGSGSVFAMKVYDKQKVERLDKRHNNTKNSIMTERASLIKASIHPSIHPPIHSSIRPCIYIERLSCVLPITVQCCSQLV